MAQATRSAQAYKATTNTRLWRPENSLMFSDMPARRVGGRLPGDLPTVVARPARVSLGRLCFAAPVVRATSLARGACAPHFREPLMSSASSFCFERLLLAGALCGAVCSWPNVALAQTASEGLASAGAGAPAPLDALDCSRRPLDCRDSSLLQRGLAERLLGHSTAIAPNRPTSMDAIAHEQGTVVLLTYEHESQLVFLDPQNEARWQRRLPALACCVALPLTGCAERFDGLSRRPSARCQRAP